MSVSFSNLQTTTLVLVVDVPSCGMGWGGTTMSWMTKVCLVLRHVTPQTKLWARSPRRTC